MADNQPRVYTVKALAEHLLTSVSSIYTVVKNGDLESVRIRTRYLIPREKVEEWLRRGGSKRV